MGAVNDSWSGAFCIFSGGYNWVRVGARVSANRPIIAIFLLHFGLCVKIVKTSSLKNVQLHENDIYAI